MSDEKEIRWVGSAYDDLLAFPDDWKPFDDVGAGTKEIRIWETSASPRRSQAPARRPSACTRIQPVSNFPSRRKRSICFAGTAGLNKYP